MKNKNLLSSIVLVIAIILNLGSGYSQSTKEYRKILASPKPITNNAVWEKLTKEKVYNNCITALHLSGFEVEPLMTSKESGLVVTKPVDFYPSFYKNKIIAGQYYLNMLVYESDTNKISINIQIKGTKVYDYKIDPSGNYKSFEVEKGSEKHNGTFTSAEIWNGLTMKISDDVDQFMNKLETIQGKAISKTTETLTWE
jgi:hypothetical protein